ncbi:optic atrophy 3 protein-like [Monomorium pharaonis]|uniref:optic atrophy 3 protein-like n=1 Tax=Monomorium pharaonis TaxID=307658 RepID=UPI001745F78A|nr:optic atrophy 3 protein-like [Monomorium pharaonis]
MVQKFPGAKLIGLLLRQITQPLSRAIVMRVKKRPLLRKYFLIQLGRFYYWCENVIKWEKIPAKKRLVDDERTLKLGTDLLLEVTVAIMGSSRALLKY